MCGCADVRMIFLGLHRFEKDYTDLKICAKQSPGEDWCICEKLDDVRTIFLGLHSEGAIRADLKRITPI
jgi:hypothetical protein